MCVSLFDERMNVRFPEVDWYISSSDPNSKAKRQPKTTFFAHSQSIWHKERKNVSVCAVCVCVSQHSSRSPFKTFNFESNSAPNAMCSRVVHTHENTFNINIPNTNNFAVYFGRNADCITSQRPRAKSATLNSPIIRR